LHSAPVASGEGYNRCTEHGLILSAGSHSHARSTWSCGSGPCCTRWRWRWRCRVPWPLAIAPARARPASFTASSNARLPTTRTRAICLSPPMNQVPRWLCRPQSRCAMAAVLRARHARPFCMPLCKAFDAQADARVTRHGAGAELREYRFIGVNTPNLARIESNASNSRETKLPSAAEIWSVHAGGKTCALFAFVHYLMWSFDTTRYGCRQIFDLSLLAQGSPLRRAANRGPRGTDVCPLVLRRWHLPRQVWRTNLAPAGPRSHRSPLTLPPPAQQWIIRPVQRIRRTISFASFQRRLVPRAGQCRRDRW